MSRSQVLTRAATGDDIPAVLELWDELRQVGGRGERSTNPVQVAEVRDRLAQVVENPSYRVILASISDVPAGMAVLHVTRPDPFTDARVVNVAHLVVARAARDKGVGHALLSAVADFATERRLEQVSVSVYPSLREASRFFARLGFAPAATRRVAPVSVLRRRLGTDPSSSVTGDALRRRSRLIRPIPAQALRRNGIDKADGSAARATRRAAAR